jgi:DNA-binding phage protein
VLSHETELNRENLYNMLSSEGNPRLSSLSILLDKLELEVAIRPKRSAGEATHFLGHGK